MAEKLVRDWIPEIILKETKILPAYRLATAAELPNLRLKKLREEISVLGIALSDGNIENIVNELADVSEVPSAMDISERPASVIVQARMKEKRHDRGGFDYGVVVDFSRS